MAAEDSTQEMDPLRLAHLRATASEQILRSHLRMLRANIPASTVVVLAIGAILWFHSDRLGVMVSVSAVVGTACAWFPLASTVSEDSVPRKVLVRITVIQLLGGLSWGSIFLLAMPDARDSQILLVMLIPLVMAANAMENTANVGTFLAFHGPFALVSGIATWVQAAHIPRPVVALLAVTSLYFVGLARVRAAEALDSAVLGARNELLTRELQRVNEDLRYQSTHDTLTSLPNRLAIERGLNTMMAEAEQRPVAALFIDLDGFKDVNDTRGHDVGDLLLVIVSRRFAEVVPEGAILGRMGGDEMVVLYRDFDGIEAVHELADAVLGTLKQRITVAGGDHDVGASAGIAMTSRQCRTGGDLLRFADIALYEAKALGGRQWVEFHADMLDTHASNQPADQARAPSVQPEPTKAATS